MIDVRWPQQHYARTAVWAGQRFPLLQRLLARAGAGEIPPGGGHTGFVYRTARAFPVTLASSGADLPGTAAARFDIRRQANPDSSGKIDLAPYSPAASTVNAGPLTDRLAQRTTRPAGVIHVQQSRQQASRTAGEFGQTVMTLQDTPDDESHDRFPLPQPLPREWGGEIRESLATFIVTLLKPLLARYDSGRGAETRSDLFRVLAASSATRPATVHNDLTAGAAPGDSLASRPAGEAAHHGQIGSLRSAVTQAAGVTPEMAVRSSIAGQVDRSPSQVDRSPLQVDRPPSTGFTAEPSPLTAGSVRVRRKVLPATAAFSTRQGAAPSGKSMAHGGQPDDQPSDRVATLAAIGGPAVPGTRTTTDPQSSDRIATNLSASTADFSATTNAGLLAGESPGVALAVRSWSLRTVAGLGAEEAASTRKRPDRVSALWPESWRASRGFKKDSVWDSVCPSSPAVRLACCLDCCTRITPGGRVVRSARWSGGGPAYSVLAAG